MLNELVVVKVSAFKGEKQADKNGIQNVWLTPIAGKLPNQTMVVAGTVAAQEDNHLEIGKTLLIMVNERESDATYGRQFGITVLTEVKGPEILGYTKELGKALVLDTKPQVQNDAAPTLNTTVITTPGLTEEPAAAGVVIE